MTGLSEESLITAGVELVRDEGWARLSVRAVAARLGVTPMALYRHMPNSEALTAAVIARVAEPLAEVRHSGDMAADLDWWARRAHSRLIDHPGAAAHLLVTWFEVPPALIAIDRMLKVVYEGGLRDFEAVAAVNALFMYVLMRAEAEQTVVKQV